MTTWLQAGFVAPYDHAAKTYQECRTPEDAIQGALGVTRLHADGRWPYPEAQRLHGNLRAAYREIAEAYDRKQIACPIPAPTMLRGAIITMPPST